MNQQRVDLYFQEEGKGLDVIFVDSHDNFHFTAEEALKVETSEKITKWYKDGEAQIRETEDMHFLNIVFMVDWLKLSKVTNRKPDYITYCLTATKTLREPLDERIYKFAYHHVFQTDGGKVQTIYVTSEKRFTKATFYKAYNTGKLFLFGDRVVYTCPTNFELMSYHIGQIFPGLVKVQI